MLGNSAIRFTVGLFIFTLPFAIGTVARFERTVPHFVMVHAALLGFGSIAAFLLLLIIGGVAATAMGLLISALANTRDQATTIVPLALVPQLLLAGVLVPKLPEVADKLAKIGVSGYWLIEAMRSVFIAAEGPVRLIEPRTGLLTEMIAEPAGRGAAIVAAQALAFLLIAYLMTLLRHDLRKRRT